MNLLGRKKDKPQPEASGSVDETIDQDVNQDGAQGVRTTAPKGRPTPKRSEAARRRGPVAPAPMTSAEARKRRKELGGPKLSKEERRADKTARRADMAERRAKMMSGEEGYLLPRDKGPVRRYIRDYVDARWNLGEFMLPVMLVVLALSFIRSAAVFAIVSIGVYGLLLVAAADGFLMWRGLKRKLIAKFGEDKLGRGQAMYAVMRTFQLRRSRMPRAQVKRGQFPA